MPRVGQARRRDRNEDGIVAALKAVGAQVTRVSGVGAPDLVIRARGACQCCGRNAWCVEVKAEKGTRTKAQEKSQWPIVRSELEALEVIGAIR